MIQLYILVLSSVNGGNAVSIKVDDITLEAVALTTL